MNRAVSLTDNRWVVLGLLLLSLIVLPAQIITPGNTPGLHFSVSGSYADPRDFASPGQTVCGNSNTNDGTNDDAPAVNRAWAFFPFVKLPWGCKFVTSIIQPGN